MSETEKARVQSTRGRKTDQSFLFDPQLKYAEKLQKCLALTQRQMQDIAAQHCGHAVALKLQLGLSAACCASMHKLIPNSEHYIKDLHEKAAQYVQDTTEQAPLLPIDPHVFYVHTETAPGVIVQATGDMHLQLDNAIFNPGELNYEDGSAFRSKRSLEMPKQMCKLAVFWGVLGFNVRLVCLRRREGVEEMRPELPRPSIQGEGAQQMANIFSRAIEKKFFRSKFELPKENTTPSSDLTQFTSKLEQKLGVRFPARASAQRPDDGARSAQADRGEPPRTCYFMGMPEEGSWISDEERYDDTQQSKDSGGNAASGACCISQKTAEEEEEEKTIKFILDGAQMEDEDNSWYMECLGYSADEDDKGSFGGESSVHAAASSTGSSMLDGASLVEALTFPSASGTPDAEAQTPEGGSAERGPVALVASGTPDGEAQTPEGGSAEQSLVAPPASGTPDGEAQTPKGGSAERGPVALVASGTPDGEAQTPEGGSAEQSMVAPPASGTHDAKAQTPEGGSAVEVPTASDAKSTGDDKSKTRISLTTSTTKGTRLRKTKKKGLDAQGANPGVSTEAECKYKAAKVTKRPREESMLRALSPAKKKTTASANMHAGASQRASDDSLHAVEPLLKSGVGAKAPRSTTKEKGSRIERMLFAGFM